MIAGIGMRPGVAGSSALRASPGTCRRVGCAVDRHLRAVRERVADPEPGTANRARQNRVPERVPVDAGALPSRVLPDLDGQIQATHEPRAECGVLRRGRRRGLHRRHRHGLRKRLTQRLHDPLDESARGGNLGGNRERAENRGEQLGDRDKHHNHHDDDHDFGFLDVRGGVFRRLGHLFELVLRLLDERLNVRRGPAERIPGLALHPFLHLAPHTGHLRADRFQRLRIRPTSLGNRPQT
ncbi:MAG TPA: hypothetical protein VF444_14835 [Pseudonocardiaceae bacterium]